MTTPTSPSNGNGHGNGNGGLTTKEYLARIDAKLDSLQAGLESVKLNFAVHEAKAHHDAARQEIEDLRAGLSENRLRLAAYAGGVAVAVFVIELAARIL